MKSLILILIAGTGAVLMREPLADANARRRLDQFRYTPDRELVKLASVGHRSTLADLMWLRAMPDLSATFKDQEHKERWVQSVLDAVVHLEPRFSTVYTYGAAYLELIRQQPEHALEFLERGVEQIPDDLGLRVSLAMAYLLNERDREKALEHLRYVANDPRCDSVTAGLCAALLVDEREDVAAIVYWNQYLESGNDSVRKVAELYLERTKRRIFLRARREYEEREGTLLTSPEELRDPSLIAPGVMDVVIECGDVVNGQPRFARLDELEQEHRLRGVRYWCEVFQSENGRWPTLEELRDNQAVPLPAPPRGMRYHLEAGDVSLVPVGD